MRSYDREARNVYYSETDETKVNIEVGGIIWEIRMTIVVLGT